MRIASSDVAMAAHSGYRQATSHREELTVRVSAPAVTPPRLDSLALGLPSVTVPVSPATPATDAPGLDPKLLRMKMAIEALSGHQVHIADLDLTPTTTPALPIAPSAPAPDTSVGWGARVYTETQHREAQTVTFHAVGTVTTSEGQTVDLAASLSLAASRVTTTTRDLRMGDVHLIDPLVINLTPAPATLTAERLAFDLDSDGTTEPIAFVAPGSALLAYDRNGDGQVNNGGELFGPRGGNGFTELADFDTDGNGWIDTADPIYQALDLWTRIDGTTTLTTLDEARIGAIHLDAVRGHFTYRSAEGNTLGQASRFGVYLREDGTAGTVQQIDLAV